MRDPKQTIRKLASGIFLFLLCAGSVVGGVKLFDIYYEFSESDNGGVGGLPGHDLSQAERSVRALELFPYEGWHMQANTRSGDFRLGSMGFAIDFDLLNPPTKELNEFRIILIGGSGAQGWGASSTEKTMARLLEKTLNQSGDNRHYRVINMAMGSANTYQNFISLNRWAHPLKPDLILSYSGVNDYANPIYSEGMLDAHYQFNRLNALAIAARGTEFPPGLMWLRDFLPNIMMKARIGYGLKVAFYPKYFEQRARESYQSSRGKTDAEPNAFMKNVITPQYINALSSIRRDFCGIPILVVFQAMHPTDHRDHLKMAPGLANDFYERMQDETMRQLKGDGWYFANFYQYVLEHPHSSITVHLTDEGQIILADYIYKNLRPILDAWSKSVAMDAGLTCSL